MAKIEDFLKEGSRPDKVKQFEKMSIGKSKEEVRILEMEMLEPEPFQPYVGEEFRYIMNSEHTIKIVFSCKEDMDFFGKFIPIADYIEKCATDLKIIFDLFRAIEAGKIIYDKKAGDFTTPCDEPPEKPKPIETERTQNAPGTFRKFFRR